MKPARVRADRKWATATVTKSRRSTARVITQKLDDSDPRMQVIRKYASNQISDPFADMYLDSSDNDFALLSPPFDYGQLMRFPNESSTLKQCVEAMVINIEGYGFSLEYTGPADQMTSAEAETEKTRIMELCAQPNPDYSLTEMRKRVRFDVEGIGDGYIEVLRDAKGRIAAFNHVPGHTIRKTTRDRELVMVDRFVVRDGKHTKIKMRQRFKRYVQQIGGKKVYFKEFGDPRQIDYTNGKAEEGSSGEKAKANYATEIIEISLYNAGHNYGVPRWINQLPAIIGSRECEMTNLQFFQDNAIPAMAILVSGGALTEESARIVEEAFTSRTGRESINRVLVLEALGDEDAADIDGKIAPPKLDMKPLAGERQTDAMFSEYEEANHTKIRSSFRLPPLFLGRADDYTRATAEASLVIAEAQVFGPERNTMDDIFNQKLLLDDTGQPPKFWKFRSNPPKMVGASQIMEALSTLDEMGALTPNIAIRMTNELFNLSIAVIEDEWGDYPFPMVLALLGQQKLEGTDALAKELEDLDIAAEGETNTKEGKAQKSVRKSLLSSLQALGSTVNG